MQNHHPNTTPNLADLTNDIKHYLQFLSDLGCKGFDCSQESLELIRLWGKPRPVNRKPVVKSEPVRETLESFRADFEGCSRCKLASTRKKAVFGAGNPQARLMFIGDAPGIEEDEVGLPFVGTTGQLLSKMIQAMTLRREDVYLCNIMKCRPPQGRKPLQEEVQACFSFLDRQIQLVKPEVICTLGAFATMTLLDVAEGVAGMRGRFYDYKGIRVMPTFHPSFLLSHPDKKRDAWADLQKVMAALGLK